MEKIKGVMMKRKAIYVLMCLGMLLAACSSGTATSTPTDGEVSSPLEGITLLGTAAAAINTPDYPQWDDPPAMTIDQQTIYMATFQMENGDIIVELFADKAPLAVNNFVFLAREGFYDNTTFFRVLEGFMAQGGDPTKSGSGGPGYSFDDEFTSELLFDGPGYLAMANGGPNSNGSQFFLTFEATPWLNARHTIFGKIVDGMDVLTEFTLRDPQESPTFEGDLLLTVVIEETAVSLLPTPTATPIPILPEVLDGRPLAELPIAERANLYTGIPAMVIDTALTYQAQIETTKGLISVELRVQDAPDLVNNFVVLANLGYWDGFPITHVEPELFMLTGSPAGDPTSDVGYVLGEQGDLSNTEGAVGFWLRQDRIAPSGSQFYILMSDLSPLDVIPTVFGYVSEGMDIVGLLTSEDLITSISIETTE